MGARLVEPRAHLANTRDHYTGATIGDRLGHATILSPLPRLFFGMCIVIALWAGFRSPLPRLKSFEGARSLSGVFVQ